MYFQAKKWQHLFSSLKLPIISLMVESRRATSTKNSRAGKTFVGLAQFLVALILALWLKYGSEHHLPSSSCTQISNKVYLPDLKWVGIFVNSKRGIDFMKSNKV